MAPKGVGKQKSTAKKTSQVELTPLSHQHHCPFPLFNEGEAERYVSLCKRKIIGCRFLDAELLGRIGLKDTVDGMLETLGWRPFAYNPVPMFKSLMLEFYTTLQFENNAETAITFRFKGNRYDVDFDLMEGLFELPSVGVVDITEDFNEQITWRQLTGITEYDAHKAPNGLIRDPSLLIVHKFMCQAIFGKAESNKASRTELFVLSCLQKNMKVVAAYWIFQSMMAAVRNPRLPLGLGHVISALARRFRRLPQVLDSDDDVMHPELFTAEYLRNADIIGRNGFEPLDFRFRRAYRTRFGNPNDPNYRVPDLPGAEAEEANEEEAAEMPAPPTYPSREAPSQPWELVLEHLQLIERRQRRMEFKMNYFFEMQGLQIPSPPPTPPPEDL